MGTCPHIQQPWGRGGTSQQCRHHVGLICHSTVGMGNMRSPRKHQRVEDGAAAGGWREPDQQHSAHQDTRFSTGRTLLSPPQHRGCAQAGDGQPWLSLTPALYRKTKIIIIKKKTENRIKKRDNEKRRCAQRCPAPDGSVPAAPGLVAGGDGWWSPCSHPCGHPGAAHGHTSAKASPHCSWRLPQRRATMAR